MDVRIALASVDDYDAIAAVTNACALSGEPLVSGDELRSWDERLPARFPRSRYVARSSGVVVGAALRSTPFDSFDPETFWIAVDVCPEARRRGVGTALYERVVADLPDCRATCLRSACREDQLESVRFLLRRGFTECSRSYTSTLDLMAFDGGRFDARRARFQALGLEVRSLASLAGDVDWREKLYDLATSVERDVPIPQAYTRPGFEEWHRLLETIVAGFTDAFLVAVDADECVAATWFGRQPSDPTELFTSFTGVRREYRGRGIAWGMKLLGIEFAKSNGFKRIRAINSSRNAPMLAINDGLGFVRQPATLEWMCREIEARPRSAGGAR